MDLHGVAALLVAIAGALAASVPRSTRKYGLVAVGVVGTAALWLVRSDWLYGQVYDHAAIGSPETNLVNDIGEPTKSTTGDLDFWGQSRGLSDRCATEFWYRAFFTPDIYEFCYSRTGRLVYKYHWSSY